MDINTGNTKEIMVNSHLEITNPGFNKMVLDKIIRRRKTRLIITHIFLYLIIVAITTAVIVARTSSLGSFADVIMNAIIQLGTWFLSNEFIILPFFILLIVKGLIDLVLYRRVNN